MNDGLLLLSFFPFLLRNCAQDSLQRTLCALTSALLSLFLSFSCIVLLFLGVSLPEYTRQNEKEVGMKGIDSRLTGRLVV